MRRPGKYREPTYQDPNDRRFVQIIRQGSHGEPRAVNLMGMPFDGAVLGRKGAAGGPEGVRAALSGFSNYNIEENIDLQSAAVVDLGDVEFPEGGDVERAHAEIEKEVAGELREGSLLVAIGGDNSISLPCLRACARKFGKIGLVVVDSHLDLRGRVGGKPTSGSSYGLALETIAEMDPHRVVEIGAHGFLSSRAYVDKARSLGIELVTAVDVEKKGGLKVADDAYRRASEGADAVYVSLDVDAVDLGQVSGVSAPSLGGISAQTFCEIALRLGGRSKVVCGDLVELAPSLDPSGKSQVVAATALAYLIGGFVSRNRA